MEEIEKEPDVFMFNEGKIFLEEVKLIIHEALKTDKKVEFKSEDLLILSLKDDVHSVFEVYKLKANSEGKTDLNPKLVYIGDKKLRISYLLNLINKEEQQSVLNSRYR